ncbi:regulatory LuxR family protein [Sediminihabitans luteus]|uniref:Regulatory LuxR family protein n=1 Tax=Sediminihabitans luteus TaxID=1138585 RepID=A0A2M9CZ72_9CELL|nr:LuxR family transcriptional regulator [Sediminihabitans luteus]PJJ77153.1 regulatory LuxR family protein [Sediminihabitans luteus]GII98601.1 LuxR family transcriptional regulator [Sediminihabitans luteus]
MTLISDTPPPVLGRADELRAVRTLVADARNGSSGSLLVRGDPGMGKTTLLEAAVSEAVGVRVLRVAGYEVESAIAYGALLRLGRPLEAYLASLPAEQREALTVAAGSVRGHAPALALVGLSMLTLLALAGDDEPLVCVVDDAHHLDVESLEVLGFVARRFSAESVVLLVAARPDARVDRALAGVPTLALEGLDAESASELLRRTVGSPIDSGVVADVLDYTQGNPLALRDLGSELTARQLTAASVAGAPMPIGRHLEDHYLRRLRELPPDARTWLLIAAAESTGDAEVVRAAASAAGLPESASDGVEEDLVVQVREAVTFRHPLVRSAVYNGSPDAHRRRAHALLRDQAVARGRPEVAAWHAAAACPGRDARVAEGLVEAARAAASRGGLRTSAHLLARAVELEPVPSRRAERQIEAAEAAIGAGAALLSRQLLAEVDEAVLDASLRARRLLVRALCGLFLSDPAELVHGAEMLLAAAAEAHGVDAELEQRATLLAFSFAPTTEGRAAQPCLADLGVRMRDAAEVAHTPTAVVLRALAAFVLEPYARAVPLLRTAVAMLDGLPDDEFLTVSYVSFYAPVALWDLETGARFLNRAVRLARARGAVRDVDAALWTLSSIELSRVNPRLSGEYLAQAAELRRAVGYVDEQVVNAAQLAWVGAPTADVERLSAAMGAIGFGGPVRMAEGALAIVDIARGEYERAYGRLAHLVGDPFLQASFHHVPELVEAAARAGRTAAAHQAAELVHRYAASTGSPWALGMSERASALLARGADAEAHHLASIEHLGCPGHEGDQARGRLLYGEWLRRVRRRGDARSQLAIAIEALDRAGAAEFAARARREMTATGEYDEVGPSRASALTPQEIQVARLAAAGATNAEIGASLYISPNTVDYHLRKVFRKLGVSSRRQLAPALGVTR